MDLQSTTANVKATTQIAPRQKNYLPFKYEGYSNVFVDLPRQLFNPFPTPFELPTRWNFDADHTWNTVKTRGDAVFSITIDYGYLAKLAQTALTKNIVDSYHSVNFDLEYLIEIRETVQHQGLGIITWLPGELDQHTVPSTYSYNLSKDINQAFYTKSLLVKACSSAAHIFKVPLRSVFNGFPTSLGGSDFIDKWKFGTLSFLIISPLKTVSSITSLPVRVSYRMTNFSASQFRGGNVIR